MTIYEQVQRALDYMEGRLFARQSQARAAGEAGMSSRSFHRYFWAVTGYSYKEYLVKRRLEEARAMLARSDARVVDIALAVGYGSHEAFSRAFKLEFGISPFRSRKEAPTGCGLEKPNLIKEMYMGVIIKELPEMLAVAFDGFAPEPESKAHAKLEAWEKKHPVNGKPRRVFGYNIDLAGNLYHQPNNPGYRFLAVIESPQEAGGERIEKIAAGKFVVTGIEGSTLNGDPTWIGEGWGKLNRMIKEKGFNVKPCPRWFEEELEPTVPSNLRLDLYLEIE
jgi:AraC-like DNA-binding protein